MVIKLILDCVVATLNDMKSTSSSPSELHGIAMSKETSASMCCDREWQAHKSWNSKRTASCLNHNYLEAFDCTVLPLTAYDDVTETQTKRCMRSQIIHTTLLRCLLVASVWLIVIANILQDSLGPRLCRFTCVDNRKAVAKKEVVVYSHRLYLTSNFITGLSIIARVHFCVLVDLSNIRPVLKSVAQTRIVFERGQSLTSTES